ncbi:hypothetical protein [Aquimarina algicola]|uniref:Uncharacterized protein n=1 Tax=Aquimarina algicola TaxID=2589995 RepID=A0A504JCZ1_9FLAO|nr:hypothetical protein [Aquimarina algicola]TPN86325.1 hypothetical protein FHK87_13755 [Aquimarina algicola]
MKNEEITFENVIEKTLEKVKHYEKESQYFIRPLQNNCVYELLVNDFPVYKDYGIEKLGTPININGVILQSGPQTVTVRLYPLGDALKRAYGEGETITTLLPKTEMKIKVVKYEAFNISDELEDEIVVKEHTSPAKEDSEEFEGAGLPYYEYTFTFNAEVPYKNEGWSNGENLTKFEKNELEGKVLSYYKMYKKLHADKKLDNIIRLEFDQELRKSRALYKSRQDIEDVWNEYKSEFDFQNLEYQPIENYELSFYGNGKVVCLKFPSKEPVDRRHRGKGAFWFKFKRSVNGSKRARWTNIYLYLPKGQPLDSLQMIP